MSEQQPGNPPIKTHRDGAVFAKVWRNEREGGEPFYSVTLGRTYSDPESGEVRESRSFSGTDILKAQAQLGEAYRTITQERAYDRANAPVPEHGLEAQRDAARAHASTPKPPADDRARSRTRQPEQ